MKKTLTLLVIVFATVVFSQQQEDFIEKNGIYLKKNQLKTEILDTFSMILMAPTVPDSILLDTTKVLYGFGAHYNTISTDGSGKVHIFAAHHQPNNVYYYDLWYHRSTDYGATFEPAVFLEDSILHFHQNICDGDSVYFMTVKGDGLQNWYIELFYSFDSGITWQKRITPLGIRNTFEVLGDTVYDFIEMGSGAWGSGIIAMYKSLNFGLVPFDSSLVGVFQVSLQTPSVAIGDGAIVYARLGGEYDSSCRAYTSQNLGENWNYPSIDLDGYPSLGTGQTPVVTFHDSIFSVIQAVSGILFNRSLDKGISFSFPKALCRPDSNNCISFPFGPLASSHNNLAVAGVDPTHYSSKDGLFLRFSRDYGETWSPVLTVEKKDAIDDWESPSLAMDDSLFYVTFAGGNVTDPFSNLYFRRGFYKFPLCELETDTLNFTGLQPSQIDTSVTITNKGNVQLKVNKIQLPGWVSLQNQNDTTFTLVPDSSKKISLQINLSSSSNGEILFFSNQQIDGTKKVVVLVDTTTAINENNNLRKTFSLSQNYPNPFNPTTKISFTLPKNFPSKLTIFNTLGEVVKEFSLDAGKNFVEWNGTNQSEKQVSSGIYFYRLQSGDFSETKKMLLLR